jgi:hypothetical protein
MIVEGSSLPEDEVVRTKNSGRPSALEVVGSGERSGSTTINNHINGGRLRSIVS